MKRLIFIFLMAVVLVFTAKAQVGSVTVEHSQLLEKNFDLSSVPWLFHPGEVEGAADPALDDSDWSLIWTDLRKDSTETARFEKYGWFRLHVTLDSTLYESGFALSFFQAGNIEVYWNGERKYETGRRPSSPEGAASRVTTGVPVYVMSPGSKTGVLAVRFDTSTWSEQWRETLQSRVRLSPGFAVIIGRIDGMANTFGRRWMKVNEFTFTMGIMLALCLLHLLLYRRESGEIAHLYFGLSVLFMIPPLLLTGISQVPSDGAFWVSGEVTTISWRYFVTIAQILWLASIFSLLLGGLGRRFWASAAVLAAIPIWFDVGIPGLSVQAVVFGVHLISTIVAIAVTVVAIRRKETDALILAFGLVGALAGLVLFQKQLDAGYLIYRTLILENAYFFSEKSPAMWLSYLSVPVAMTVLLSKRYTESRFRLQSTVKERTAELSTALEDLRSTQDRMIQQEKMASLGSLTSGIAHEIRNPLNFVNNFAELAAELTVELKAAIASGDHSEVNFILDDLSSNTTQIVKHGKRADSIVTAMMQHASGGDSISEERDINAFVDEYVNLAWHGARSKSPSMNSEISRIYGENVGKLSIQPQELGRVLVNLLSNAFYAVQKVDKPVVRVRTERSGKNIRISVSDNGSGVSEKDRDKIFEPFFTTKPTGEGTGLGLSMSYDVVTKGHGGMLSVSDAPGGGALFVIDLPLPGH